MAAFSAADAASGELIVLCDGADRIRFVNRHFSHVFGAPSQSWHGRDFAPDGGGDPGDVRSFITAAKCAEGDIVIDWRLEVLSGGEKLYAGVVRRGDAPIEDCEKAAESRIQFIATISHEMRTPLNGILGMASLLLDTDLTANQRAYVEAVRQSGASLLALTNDILDFSKLDAGKLDFERAPYDPYALVQSVTELLSPRAVEKSIEVASYVNPATPRRLIGDEARVRQILLNLASNAIKFTKSGGVAIELSTETSVEGLRLVGVVRDTGVGIPKDAQSSLFERFSQVDTDAERRAQGTGLGLAISRRLARAMGGDIIFKSKEGKGSVFTFSVAAGPATETPRAPKVDAPPIVIATSSPILGRVLRLQLQAFGVPKFQIAEDAREVAFLLSENPGALLLIDNQTAGQGMSAALDAAARALILLTPNERGEIETLRKQGFHGYLMKPIRQSTLMREIARGGRKVEAAKVVVKTPTPTVNRVLKILLAEDNQINAVLATTLIRRAGHKVDVAENGEEAVTAVAAGGYDIVFMDMHMPVCDGLEASRRIRMLEGETGKIPIIALTANAMSSDRQKCVAAGMNDFLSKPFEPSDIHEMLVKWAADEPSFEAAS